jgi:formylglycine-generating enzyme required for sulfatase activity
MDEHPVTIGEFRRFVKATDYVTVAERPIDPAQYPGADPALLVPGSLVFRRTRGPVDLRDYRNWWTYVPGACWRRPEGPGSDTSTRGRHPVVHVAYEDAEAYATWVGKTLPSEAEWEFAARGGLDGATYAWGDEFAPEGRIMANTWQGEFPWQNLRLDGYDGTSPVAVFPPNGYGLYDVTGNVWEWTGDYYAPGHEHPPDKAPCATDRPPASHRPSTPRPATSGSAASSGPARDRRLRPDRRPWPPRASRSTTRTWSLSTARFPIATVSVFWWHEAR